MRTAKVHAGSHMRCGVVWNAMKRGVYRDKSRLTPLVAYHHQEPLSESPSPVKQLAPIRTVTAQGARRVRIANSNAASADQAIHQTGLGRSISRPQDPKNRWTRVLPFRIRGSFSCLHSVSPDLTPRDTNLNPLAAQTSKLPLTDF